MKTIKKVEISTDYIRLDTLLKLSGVSSTGGQAGILIDLGEVSVNSRQCLVRGRKINPGDVVCVHGGEFNIQVIKG